MARPGIGYDEVKSAALALLRQGQQPSIQRIRQLLGTGSHSTIGGHLKRWQQEQASLSEAVPLPAVPEAVVEALQSCWRTAVEQAEAGYQERRQQLERAVTEAGRQREAALRQGEQARQEEAACRRELTDTQAMLRTVQEQRAVEGAVAKERLQQAEAAIATHESRATEAVEAVEQIRTEAEAQTARLEALLRQTRKDTERQLAQAEQRLQAERERGEAGETRLLRLIDQIRGEYAREQQRFEREKTSWKQREQSLQTRLETLRRELVLSREQGVETEARSRGLDTELNTTRAALQDRERQVQKADRLIEALRLKLKTAGKERQALKMELQRRLST